MKNYQKNQKYSELMEKLKKSVEEEFYYEAIFIIYAIIEDRTESLLKHANLNTLDEENRDLTLHSKLKIIKEDNNFNNEYAKKHISKDLIKKIYLWKHKRNDLIHDLVNTNYNNEEIKKLAYEGYDIVKILNNKSTLINKYNDNIHVNK